MLMASKLDHSLDQAQASIDHSSTQISQYDRVNMLSPSSTNNGCKDITEQSIKPTSKTDQSSNISFDLRRKINQMSQSKHQSKHSR